MKMLKQMLKTMRVERLEEHPRNPRKGDEARIAESIEENGFFGTIVVQKSTNFVLAGNHRLRVLKENGVGEVDVAIVDVDDDQALRILLADNKTSDNGTYDASGLVAILEELNASGSGISGTGYHAGDLDKLISEVERASNAELTLTGGGVGELPGGDVTNMNFSTVRQVQLFFDEKSLGDFESGVAIIKEYFGVTNVSDAVIGAVQYARGKIEGERSPK